MGPCLKLLLVLPGLMMAIHLSAGAAPAAPASEDMPALWSEHSLIAFEHEGCPGFLVAPPSAAPGNPWILSGQPLVPDSVTKSFLEKGFHLAWIHAHDLYGNDKAVDAWEALYTWAVGSRELSEKPALICQGENALLVFNWSARRPERAACILADEPWLQLEALPEIEPATWARICDAYGVVGGALEPVAARMPVSAAPAFAEIGVPILFLNAEKGAIPGLKKQAELFYRNYRHAAYGPIEIVIKSGKEDVGREGLAMHTLYFILKHTGALSETPVGEAIPRMPEWEPADFSGQAGVFVLDDALIMESGNDMTGVRWRGEAPALDYEITLEAMRLAGGDFFCGLTAPFQDTFFSLVVGGWGGTCVGISSLDWLDAYHNETAQFRTFHAHQWYPVKLRVTGERIQAWVNKEQLVDVEIGERTVDIRWEMAPTRPLGIATWRTTGAIRNFKVAPL